VKALRWNFGVPFGIAAVLAAVLAVGCAWNAAAPPAADSESARHLASGPHRVATFDTVFVDASRPTDANGDFAGAPARTLPATIWYPKGAAAAHPLLVYSHGFMSMRSENAPLTVLLASHGYVVVAVDYPLTKFRAPGGPNVRDVVNQPDDIRFVIDRVLAWGPSERPFAGEIDRDRIGAVGLSLGGLTTTLAAFHPWLRDPRIAAAVSIAGPAAMFLPAFFATADIPFLMIAGTGDAIIPYESNAAPIPRMVRRGGLVSITGASHAGFSAFAGRFPLRLLANPDLIGCYALTHNLEDPIEHPFEKLGGEAEGILLDPNAPLPCHDGTPASALAAGRQLMITRLAALAFFESRFAKDTAVRTAYDAFLRETLAHDFPEATFLAAGNDERIGTGR
jgi:dienelactone hydrolase